MQISDLPSKYFEFRLSIVVIYAFGAENAASSSNLPIPFCQNNEAVSNFAFETASLSYVNNKKLDISKLMLTKKRLFNKEHSSVFCWLYGRNAFFGITDDEIADALELSLNA